MDERLAARSADLCTLIRGSRRVHNVSMSWTLGSKVAFIDVPSDAIRRASTISRSPQ